MPTLFSMVLHKKISIGSSVSKTHLPELSNTVQHDTHSSGILKHLHWLPIEQRIHLKLATLTHNTLCSTQPAYLHSLLNYHTPHVLYALQTLTCCPFLVFALHLPPVVSVLQPPLCGTRSHLAFATLPLTIPSVALLKPTASSRLLAPPSVHPSASDSASG